MWLLVPLGNPGDAYVSTRHNFGRLIFHRWLKNNYLVNCKIIRKLRHGTIYKVSDNINVLIPKTYMNLSGISCAEALLHGYSMKNIIIICDDKDLPFGFGRLRLFGSAAGHNGLKSIFEELRCQEIPRLRLGIGPFSRPLSKFVLEKWTDQELVYIKKMDSVFNRFMELVEDSRKDLNAMLNIINDKTFWLIK